MSYTKTKPASRERALVQGFPGETCLPPEAGVRIKSKQTGINVWQKTRKTQCCLEMVRASTPDSVFCESSACPSTWLQGQKALCLGRLTEVTTQMKEGRRGLSQHLSFVSPFAPTFTNKNHTSSVLPSRVSSGALGGKRRLCQALALHLAGEPWISAETSACSFPLRGPGRAPSGLGRRSCLAPSPEPPLLASF